MVNLVSINDQGYIVDVERTGEIFRLTCDPQEVTLLLSGLNLLRSELTAHSIVTGTRPHSDVLSLRSISELTEVLDGPEARRRQLRGDTETFAVTPDQATMLWQGSSLAVVRAIGAESLLGGSSGEQLAQCRQDFGRLSDTLSDVAAPRLTEGPE